MDPFRKAVGMKTPAGPGTENAPAGENSLLFREYPRLPTIREAEEQLIAEAMSRARNNQGIAASLLGITRQALNKRLVRGARAGKGGDSPGG